MIKDDLKFINFMKEREDIYVTIKSMSAVLEVLSEEQISKLEGEVELQRIEDLIHEIEAYEDIISWDYLKMTLQGCRSLTNEERDNVIKIHSEKITKKSLKELVELLTRNEH